MIWLLTTESEVAEEEHGDRRNVNSHGFQGEIAGPDQLPNLTKTLIGRILHGFSPMMLQAYEEVLLIRKRKKKDLIFSFAFAFCLLLLLLFLFLLLLLPFAFFFL